MEEDLAGLLERHRLKRKLVALLEGAAEIDEGADIARYYSIKFLRNKMTEDHIAFYSYMI